MSQRLSVSLHELCVRRGAKWVLQEVTWVLRPGERWALLGDNGAGKTQLLKVLAGDVWPTPSGLARRGLARPGLAHRQYRVGRVAVDLTEAKQRLAYVGAELQDKYARYGWNLPVRDLVATGVHRSDLLLEDVTASQKKRVTATLRACGLTRYASRQFLSLSYGQKRLALLARALVQQPDWLFLDEFYNGLDVDYRRRIDAVLEKARAGGQSWVASAHRAMDVPKGTRRLLELRNGRVTALGPIRRADLARLAVRADEQPQPGVRPARRSAAGEKANAPAPVLVHLSNVSLFVDYRSVLRDVNWELHLGEHWAIYGANGAGKSSFLKLLYGDLSPALGGRIRRTGFPFGTPIAEWKRQVGYVSPELQSDYAVNVNVLELVASGRYASIGLVDPMTDADRMEAVRWLKFFGLSSLANRQPRELSYGQLRRALVARAMAANPRFLLLDEPLTGLDPTQRALLKRLLSRLMRHVTLVIAVHHAEDLPRDMTHGLHLHNRRASPVDSYFAT